MRGALREVTHDEDVAVVLEHVHGVLDGLLIEVAGAGHLGVGEAGDVTAEAMHCRFVGESGARRRLVERRDQGLVGEKVGIAAFPSDRLEAVGDLEEVFELVPFEFLE